MTTPRIAVIGTGSTGAMTLWHLARRGVPAVGYDQLAPGHDNGAAGGESRIFRTAYAEGPEYVPLLRRSHELWRELEQLTSTELLLLCGGLSVGPADDPGMQNVLASASEHGLQLEAMDAADAAARYPEHLIRDSEVVALDREAGLLRPEPAVQAAATAATAAGAELCAYTPVTAVEPLDDRVRVHTADGVDEFEQVVWAPGPWATHANPTGLDLHIRQIGSLWFPAEQPADYHPDRSPVMMRRGDQHNSVFPSLDGLTVKILIHHLERPVLSSMQELSRTVPPDFLAAARAVAADLVPGLRPDPVRTGVFADCFTPDGHGYVGRVPERPRLVALTGFCGHGFKLAPVLGELAAGIVVDDDPGYDIGFLDPSRALA